MEKLSWGMNSFLVLLPSSYQHLTRSAQSCLCTGYFWTCGGLEEGHSCSPIALSLLGKAGGRLIRDDLTTSLSEHQVGLFGFKKLLINRAHMFLLPFIKHQLLNTWLYLIQFCLALYLWQNKLHWLIKLAQFYYWLLICFLYNQCQLRISCGAV